ncbi:putative nucleotide-diphospho-sugar transferase, partial [uncultured Bilophila sp.]|uniref:putative nucleotide-diphospho-sugar transferase n=1 Tax=uncultured Bilophila sp. TaxID=529385 RepID=UPI00266F2833
YFTFLKIFEKNVFNRYHFFPIIYDLGLTEDQRKLLKSEIRKIPISQSFYMKNSSNYIQATHKPSCILDYFSYHNKNILYVDADTLFVSTFNHTLFKDIDIAITPRHRKERKKEYYTNGFINSGVLFFRNTNSVKELLLLWEKKCCDPDTTDQKALSDIFSDQINLLEAKHIQKWNDLNILLLEAEIYNDVACKTGKLLHFKNAGRNEKAFKKYQQYAKVQSLFPNIFQSVISLYRKYNILYNNIIKREKL